MRVRPLKKASTASNLPNGVEKKLCVANAETTTRRQFPSYDFHCLELIRGRKSLRFLMRHKAFKVMRVTHQFGLRRSITLLVVIPIPHADPTELMSTTARLPACHVHTA